MGVIGTGAPRFLQHRLEGTGSILAVSPGVQRNLVINFSLNSLHKLEFVAKWASLHTSVQVSCFIMSSAYAFHLALNLQGVLWVLKWKYVIWFTNYFLCSVSLSNRILGGIGLMTLWAARKVLNCKYLKKSVLGGSNSFSICQVADINEPICSLKLISETFDLKLFIDPLLVNGKTSFVDVKSAWSDLKRIFHSDSSFEGCLKMVHKDWLGSYFWCSCFNDPPNPPSPLVCC